MKSGPATPMIGYNVGMRTPFPVIAASMVAAGLVLASSLPALAQSAPCPFASSDAVSGVLGSVQTSVQPNAGPGVDFCDFVDGNGKDFALTHESNTFQPGE